MVAYFLLLTAYCLLLAKGLEFPWLPKPVGDLASPGDINSETSLCLLLESCSVDVTVSQRRSMQQQKSLVCLELPTVSGLHANCANPTAHLRPARVWVPFPSGAFLGGVAEHAAMK